MSRGTARSTMNIGRWRRALIARSTVPLPRRGASSRCRTRRYRIRAGARQIAQLDRVAVKRCASAVPAPACGWPRDGARLLRGEMGGAQFDHLARADEQDLLLLQAGKMRAASFTDAAAIDTTLAPICVLVRTSLATAKERWNNCAAAFPACLPIPPGAPPPSSGPGSAARQHHRFQAGGDAKRVAHCLFLGQGVDVGFTPAASCGDNRPSTTAVPAARLRNSTVRCGCK